MKFNNTFWTIVIILIVAIIGLILIFKTESITGQTYNYGANFGPQGQRPIKVTDSNFKIKDNEVKQLKPYVGACCDTLNIAKAGLSRCPETLELFEDVCSVVEDEDLKINFPPCPPNNLVCFIPFE